MNSTCGGQEGKKKLMIAMMAETCKRQGADQKTVDEGVLDALAMAYLYEKFLTHPNILNILRRCADPANHPLFFHCTAGKDRTGVTAMLLQLALGIPREAIVKDYARTDEARGDLMVNMEMFLGKEFMKNPEKVKTV